MSNEVARQCIAHLTDGSGQRCKKSAMLGQQVCNKHGGAAPQNRAAAKRRLAELVEPAIGALERALAANDMRAVVAAAKLVLDRTGHPGESRIEVNEKVEAEWLRWATDREIKVVLRIIKRADGRRDAGEPEQRHRQQLGDSDSEEVEVTL